MSANIQDVANKAHVSVSTVSRSFTRPNLVSASTRNKVLAIAEKMNFSISKSAAALKSGKTLRIALLISDQIRLWFSASIIQGLNQVFHTAGYDLSIFQISSSKERSEFFTMLPTRRNADARVYNILCKHKKEYKKKEATSCIINLPKQINKGVTSKWILTQN